MSEDDGIRFDTLKDEVDFPATARPLAGRFTGSPRWDRFFDGKIHSFIIDATATTPERKFKGTIVGNVPVYKSTVNALKQALTRYNKRKGTDYALKAAYDFNAQRFYLQAVTRVKKANKG